METLYKIGDVAYYLGVINDEPRIIKAIVTGICLDDEINYLYRLDCSQKREWISENKLYQNEEELLESLGSIVVV